MPGRVSTAVRAALSAVTWRYLVPAILLFGSSARPSVVGIGYLALAAAHVLRFRRLKTRSEFHRAYVGRFSCTLLIQLLFYAVSLILSFCSLILLLVFLVSRGASSDDEGSGSAETAAETWHGLFGLTTRPAGLVFYVLADSAVALCSVVGVFVAFMAPRHPPPPQKVSETPSKASEVTSGIAIVVVGVLAAVSLPSFLSVPYFVFCVGTTITAAFLQTYSLVAPMLVCAPLVSAYSLLHWTFLYVLQIPPCGAGLSHTARDLLGVPSLFVPGASSWPQWLLFCSVVSLFVVSSQSPSAWGRAKDKRCKPGTTDATLHQELLRKRYDSGCGALQALELDDRSHSRNLLGSEGEGNVEESRGDGSGNEEVQMDHKERRRRRRALGFVYPHGWKVCTVILVVCCFLACGVPFFVLLTVLLVNTLAPSTRASRAGPVVLVFFVAVLCAQFCVNLPLHTFETAQAKHGEVFSDLSVPKFSHTSFPVVLASELLAALLLAVYVRFQTQARQFFGDLPNLPAESPAPSIVVATSMLYSGSSKVRRESEDRERKGVVLEAVSKVKELILCIVSVAVVGFVRYSYLVALGALYFVCLRGANLLNFVFMIFFLFFLVSPRLARSRWSWLVIYTQLVLLLRYAWQLHWIPESSGLSSVIGLAKHTATVPVWRTLIWECAIVVFVTIQWFCLRMFSGFTALPEGVISRRFSSSLSTGFTEMERISFTVLHTLFSDGDRMFFCRLGLAACYTALLVTGILLPLSVVSLLYLFMGLLCLLVHFHLAKAEQLLRRIWLGFVVGEAAILFYVYAFQFTVLREFVEKMYAQTFLSSRIPLVELGLAEFGRSMMFLRFLPYVVNLVFGVIQLRTFFTKPLDDAESRKQLSARLDAIYRFLFKFSPFLVFLFASVTFLREVSGINFLCLFLLSMSMSHHYGPDFVGGILVWISALVALGTLVYNSSFFGSWHFAHREVAAWLGARRDYDRERPLSVHWENMSMVARWIALLSFEVIQRVSLRWGTRVAREAMPDTPLKFSRELLPLFRSLRGFEAASKTLRMRVLWIVSSLPSLLVPQMAFLSLCVALFLRANTILGYFYLAILVVVRLSPPRVLRRPVYLLFLPIQILVIFCQYGALLGFPPFPSPRPWPWTGVWSPRVLCWLLFSQPRPIAILLDLIVLYLATSALSISSGQRNIYDVLRVSSPHFPRKPRSLADSVRFFLLRWAAEVFVVVLFLVGAIKKDVVSIVFLGSSLILLFANDNLFESPKIWTSVFWLTSAIMAGQLVFQTVFVFLGRDTNLTSLSDAGRVFGFYWSDPSVDVAPQFQVFVTIAVLFLLSAQHSVASALREDFQKVRAYNNSRQDREETKARELVRLQGDLAIKKIDLIHDEKLKRRQRLNALRESRRLRNFSTVSLPALADDAMEEEGAWGGLFSQLDVAESAMAASVAPAGGAASLEDVPQKTPIKLRLLALAKKARFALGLLVDRLIIALFGPESRLSSWEMRTYLEPVYARCPGEVPSCTSPALSNLSRESPRPLETGASEAKLAESVGQFSRLQLLGMALYHYLRKNTLLLCVVVLLIAHLTTGTLLSLVYVLLAGGYLVMCRKQPRKWFWNLVMLYSTVILCLKFVMQLPGFCICNGPNWSYWYYSSSVIPLESPPMVCPQESCSINNGKSARFFSLPFLLGLHPSRSYFASQVIWDFVLLLTVMFHIQVMESQGLWGERMKTALAEERKRVTDRLIKWSQEDVVASPNFVVASSDVPAVPGRPDLLSFSAGDSIRVLSRGIKPGPTSIGELNGATGAFDISLTTSEMPPAAQAFRSSKMSLPSARSSVTPSPLPPEQPSQQMDAYQPPQLPPQIAERGPEELPVEVVTSPTPTTTTTTTGTTTTSQTSGGADTPCGVAETTNVSDSTSQQPASITEVEDGSVPSRQQDTGASLAVQSLKGIESRLRRMGLSFRKFFANVLFDRARIGVDLYTPLFLIDFACLLYVVIVGATFTGASGQLVDYIQHSYIPLSYVVLVLFQFLVILMDRIIYLTRQTIAKLVLQYASLVLYNVVMMYYFPYVMEEDDEQVLDSEKHSDWVSPFSSSVTLRILFVLKCVYWVVSGVQLRKGYPLISWERFLMRGYTTVHDLAFTAYRAIPFVFELRSILDWTFSRTTLSVWDYLKVEDAYAQLFKNKCYLVSEQSLKRKPGEPRPLWEKATTGCLFFTALCAAIWLPLILLSSSFQGMSAVEIVPVNRVDIAAGIAGWKPLFQESLATEATIQKVFSQDFRKLRAGRTWIPRDKDSLQLLKFQTFSESIWGLSEPSRTALLAALNNPLLKMTFTTSLTLMRQSIQNPEVTFSSSILLSTEEKLALAVAMNSTPPYSASFTVKLTGTVPRAIRMPGTSSMADSPCTTAMPPCTPIVSVLRYHGSINSSASSPEDFWELEQVPEYVPNGFFNSTRLQLVVSNTPVSNSSLLGSLAALGLIGIYTSIVLALGRVVRMMTAGLSKAIMFENMPDCTVLLQLCKDIILARHDGDLLLEEELSNELIEIYRSSERLIDKTKAKPKSD